VLYNLTSRAGLALFVISLFFVLVWSITCLVTSSHKQAMEDVVVGWWIIIGFVASYNDGQLKKVILSIIGTNILHAEGSNKCTTLTLVEVEQIDEA